MFIILEERRCPSRSTRVLLRRLKFQWRLRNEDFSMSRPLSCDDSSSLETAERDDVKLFLAIPVFVAQ